MSWLAFASTGLSAFRLFFAPEVFCLFECIYACFWAGMLQLFTFSSRFRTVGVIPLIEIALSSWIGSFSSQSCARGCFASSTQLFACECSTISFGFRLCWIVAVAQVSQSSGVCFANVGFCTCRVIDNLTFALTDGSCALDVGFCSCWLLSAFAILRLLRVDLINPGLSASWHALASKISRSNRFELLSFWGGTFGCFLACSQLCAAERVLIIAKLSTIGPSTTSPKLYTCEVIVIAPISYMIGLSVVSA